LGARILSVVDCFDALISDRPYRPRLSEDDAFAILRERRGNLYDPLVVDTFVRTYAEIAPIAMRAGQDMRSLVSGSELASTSSSPADATLRQISANASEVALQDIWGRELAKAPSIGQAVVTAGQYLRQLTPATVFALFEYEVESDSLNCRATFGDNQRLLEGLNIKLGERVTGWSAANRSVSMNSNASLDLVQIADFFSPPLRSALSVPYSEGARLIGVLTAYSPKKDAFDENHRYTLEHVGSALFGRISALQTYPSAVLPFSKHKA
jgi:putative methionine-R-sulfoxide reductase with GAF domain